MLQEVESVWCWDAEFEDDHPGQSELGYPHQDCQDLSKSERENYVTLANTGVHHYSTNIIDLVPVGGNSYRVCTLAIVDSGGSDITRKMPEQTGQKQTREVFLS